MPATGMDYWIIVGVLAGVLAAYVGWRQLRAKKPDVSQTMTDSRGSSQTVASAAQKTVSQTMKNSTDSDQNA